MPARCAKRAAHLPPLPHISASLPSALKNRHLKSARCESSIRIRPVRTHRELAPADAPRDLASPHRIH